MFNKLGRSSGGGRGNGKQRSILHPQPGRPIGSRNSSLPVAGRGRGRGRGTLSAGRGRVTPPPEASSSGKEENFSMVSTEALDFGSIIRLAPDLVDEIRKAEARGGRVRIKFDPFSNDPSGNVIDVDGKEFKFSWSNDTGDLCDIYEERQSGEDGNGLLVERGSAWRKLNVQRVLDESVKNHVKMRSEEAERRNKARKAIVLDPANPSVKNQSSAAVEGSMRRNWHMRKEPPFKKHKIESTQGKETNSRGAFNSSNSLIRHRNTLNSQCTDLRSHLTKLLSENPKGMSLKALEKAVGETRPHSPRSIESVLKNIATFQAPGRYLLKSAVGVDSNVRLLSKSGSSTDPEIAREGKAVLRHEGKATIGNEQAPPDAPITNTDLPISYTDAPIAHIDAHVTDNDAPITDTDAPIMDTKMVNCSEDKADSSSDSGSSSDSESDSSDSGSESGSQSRSLADSGSSSSSDSESDGSSSSKGTDVEVNITASDDEKDELDNESSAAKLKSSTLAGECSTPDEQHDQNGLFQHQQINVASSPHQSHFPERSLDVSHTVKNTKDMPFNNSFTSPESPDVKITEENIGPIDGKQFDGEMASIAASQEPLVTGQMDSYWGLSEVTDDQNLFHGRKASNGTKDIFDHGQSHISGRTPRSKPKHTPECNNVNEKAEVTRKPKNTGYPLSVGQRKDFNKSKLPMASDKLKQNQFCDGAKLTTINAMQNSSVADDFHEDGQFMPERSSPNFSSGNLLDAQDSGRRSSDFDGKKKPFSMEKSGRSVDSLDTVAKQSERLSGRSVDSLDTVAKQSERLSGRSVDNLDTVAKQTERISAYSDSDFSTQRNPPRKEHISIGKDKYHRDSQNEVLEYGGKSNSGPVRGSNLSGRASFHESVYKKSSEQARNHKDDPMNLGMQMSEMDKVTSVSEKVSKLKREHSELELGEFREPTSAEHSQGNRMNLEKKGSFKTSKNKINGDDDFIPAYKKTKSTLDAIHESKKESPISENRNHNSQGLPSKTSENTSSKPQQRVSTSHHRKSKQADLDSRSNVPRLPEPSRREESKGTLWKTANSDLEEGCRPVAENVQQKDSRYMADRMQQKVNDLREPADKKNDISKKDANSNVERMGFEDRATLFFSKFEKDEPDLRGPIRDYSQYREYMQEYEEKYECYLSLNEFMEKTRAEFMKIGGNFPELARRKDRKAYNECCTRIIKFARQNKMRDNRIKKTFLVLHEELKVLKERIKDFAAEYSQD